MSALEATERLYRPSHRIDKPGHLRKIGKAKYTPKKRQKTSVVEQPRPNTWAWNDTASHDTILDGMDYCEAFDKIITTLASPDPTDGDDYRNIYNTTKDENLPARNLLIAVLFSSWCDLHGFGIRARTKKIIALREIAWMSCPDESYIYSFGSICDMLDINRDAVFRAMLNGADIKRKYSTSNF